MTFAKQEIQSLIEQGINKAVNAFQGNHFNAVENILKQVKRVGCESNEVNHLLALALHRQGKHDEALPILRHLVRRENNPNWEHFNSLGVVLSAIGGEDHQREAIKHLHRAVEMDEGNILPLSNLALAYQWFGVFDESEKLLKRALVKADEEQRALIWFNLGNLFLDKGQSSTAAGCFTKCVERVPEFTAARWNRAAALLSDKRFKNGWKEYEVRWDQFPHLDRYRERYSEYERWEGQELHGMRVLLYAEQGAGDLIQFIRFAKHLVDRDAEVVVDLCADALRGDLRTLLLNVECVDEVVDTRMQEVDIDFCQSVCSLPYILGLNKEQDLYADPYIVPSTDFAPELESHLWKPYEDRFKVGLAWAGSPSHHNDKRRSMHVQALTPLCRYCERRDDIQLFSLQKGSGRRQWGHQTVNLSYGLDKMPIIDLSHLMPDYNATANVISQLDLVVTVDTAVAHLAGAMGKRVFLMLPRTPDWRWSDDTYSYWYPNMRLFRQRSHDNWSGVVTGVIETIEALITRA
jgi:tetratricopeptide (TPR) repeat protein